jgi:tRNA A-37 threonylcarbamoyl transferase component Bud32
MNSIEDQNITIRDATQSSKPVELVIGRCLRSVPGRRGVYEGVFEGQSAVIKIFLSPLQGRRHFRRELKGLKLLRQRQIASPGVLAQGRSANGNWVLVLKKIENTADIDSILTDPGAAAERKDFLRKTLHLLAQMHTAGVLQRDLHLENFLWDKTTVYALDPAQMRFGSKPIAQRESFRQLGLLSTGFLSSPGHERKELLDAYFRKRGWELNDSTLDRIEQLAWKAKQRQIERRLKKTLRTCTHFVRQKAGAWCGVFDRPIFDTQDLAGFMAGLDDAMDTGDILKNGNTCFVSRIQLCGRDIVVKRYNHKGLWHSLRHTLKGSRAKKCWQFGHRLKWLEIPVAKPLAYIELRHYGIIRQSYILNDYIEGSTICDYVNQPDVDENTREQVRAKTFALLRQIVEHQITHGDLKATNILICDDQPVLIDLDSMKRHRCGWLLKLSQRKMENKILEQNL